MKSFMTFWVEKDAVHNRLWGAPDADARSRSWVPIPREEGWARVCLAPPPAASAVLRRLF